MSDLSFQFIFNWTCSDDKSQRTISQSGSNVVDVCCVAREGCSQGGTYEFWMTAQALPPMIVAFVIVLVFILYPNSIIRRLPMMVPGLRVKFQCKRDQDTLNPTEVWASGAVPERARSENNLSNRQNTRLLNADEAESLGYAQTGKVVFQLEAYNRILHPEKRILLLCLLFPVLYVTLYIWDKSIVRKVGYTAYPQNACDTGYDCFWSSEDYALFAWPTYHALDCQNHSRRDPPEDAEFYKCFSVVFSFRETIGAIADAGSILVLIVVILCYKSSAPAAMMKTGSDQAADPEGMRFAQKHLKDDIVRQRTMMILFFLVGFGSIPPGIWSYGRYVNSLESLALMPASCCFFGFLCLSQLRVNTWLLAKINHLEVDDSPGAISASSQAKLSRDQMTPVMKEVGRLDLENPETVSRVLERVLAGILETNQQSDMPSSLKAMIKQVVEEELNEKKASIYDIVLDRDDNEDADTNQPEDTSESRRGLLTTP